MKRLHLSNPLTIDPPKRKPREAIQGRLRALRKLMHEQPKSAMPRRHVEAYVACPIGVELRQRLGEFLTCNQDLDEEAALALLLERGLRKTEDDRKKAVASSIRPFPKHPPIDFSSVPESVIVDLDDRLRDRLEEFSVTHPGDIETAIATLIDVGLDAVKGDPGVLDPARVIEVMKNEEPVATTGTTAREKRAAATSGASRQPLKSGAKGGRAALGPSRHGVNTICPHLGQRPPEYLDARGQNDDESGANLVGLDHAS